jgi:hypothetical protein
MAIEAKITALINAEIDGQISAEDQALLDRYLAENDAARTFRDELSSLCSELDAMNDVPLPADLRQPALERAGIAAKTAKPVQRPVRRGWQSILNEFLSTAPLRYAVSFATGVVLTLALFSSDQISRQAFDDVTGLVGTMSEPGTTGDATIVDRMGLTLNELAGSVSLASSGSLMILDFNLVSEKPVEIVAKFDDRDVWFNGFAQLESAGTSVIAQSGQVTVRMEGQRRYAVYLHNTGRRAAIVRLSFYASGQLLHEGELILREMN